MASWQVKCTHVLSAVVEPLGKNWISECTFEWELLKPPYKSTLKEQRNVWEGHRMGRSYLRAKTCIVSSVRTSQFERYKVRRFVQLLIVSLHGHYLQNTEISRRKRRLTIQQLDAESSRSRNKMWDPEMKVWRHTGPKRSAAKSFLIWICNGL